MKYVDCDHCNVPLLWKTRTDTRFCSSACRQRAYRRRNLGEAEFIDTRTFRLTAPIARGHLQNRNATPRRRTRS